MTTIFQKAGYTKDTKFKTLVDTDIPKGSIVVILKDDGTKNPFFKLETSKATTTGNARFLEYGCFSLPGMTSDGIERLEVYNQNDDNPTITHNLTIKGVTHILTTEELIGVWSIINRIIVGD